VDFGTNAVTYAIVDALMSGSAAVVANAAAVPVSTV
jgi:hypothetical protein